MCLRKVYPQCNTVVHVKRSVCDCGHAFALKKRKAWCSDDGKPVNAMNVTNFILQVTQKWLERRLIGKRFRGCTPKSMRTS